MKNRWSNLDRNLKIRIELFRFLLAIGRFFRVIVPLLLFVVLLRLLFVYGFLSEGFLFVAGVSSVLMAIVFLIRQFHRYTPTHRETIKYLVRKNSVWEPLRAYLFRGDSSASHPYFEQELNRAVDHLSSTSSVLAEINTAERLKLVVNGCLIGLVILSMTVVPAPEFGTDENVPLRLEVSRAQVLKGDTVTVSLRGLERGLRPTLTVREADHQSRTVKPEWRNGEWQWQSYPLSRSISVRATINRRPSSPKSVTVVSPPRLSVAFKKITPPRYTGLPERNSGENQVEVLPGSQVTIDASANRPMKNISLKTAEGSELKQVGARQKLTHAERTMREQTYVVSAVDTYGFRADTVQRVVSLRKDGHPRLELREPDPEQKVEGNGLLSIRAWFNDDFGLTRGRVSYWREESSRETRSIPVPDDQSEGELYGQIDRNGLGLMTGDTFQFQLTVWDNDDVNGPKSTTIGPFTVEVFSWAEMMKRRERNMSSGVNKLSKMQETVEQLRSELEEMARKQESADWEVARKLQKAQKSLEKQQQQLQQAQKRVQQYSEGGKGLSRESLEKLRNVRKMMKEYGGENLKKAQESLSKAVQEQLENKSFSKKDLQYSGDQLKSFERDIERMHDFLEEAGPMLKMDEMSRTLQSMSEEQQQWMKDGEWKNQDRRELERQREQWEWMEEQLDELGESTTGEAKKRIEEMRKQMERMEMASEAKEMLNKSSPSQQEREEYRKKTRELRNQMQNTLQQQSGQMAQKQRNLRSTLVDYWTEWYAELQGWGRHLRTMEVPPRFAGRFSTSMEPLNRAMEKTTDLQEGLVYVGNLTAQIGKMSTSFPREILQTIPEHATRLNKSLDQIQQRKIGRARSTSNQLMKSQARLIERLLEWDSSNQSQSSQSSQGEGSPSLSQLMEQQRRLMQGMMPMMGSKKVPSSLAQQFLQQQQMIRRGLQQLARQQQQNKDVLGDLKSISNEMEEAEEKMAEEEFDKTLESKQKTILKRMEQATKSLSSEDEEKKQTSQERLATPGGPDTVPVTSSDYQEILDRIKSDISTMEPSEREAVLRFYRYWFQEMNEEEPTVQ